MPSPLKKSSNTDHIIFDHIKNGDTQKLEKVLQNKPRFVNVYNSVGNSPLTLACKVNNEKAVQILINFHHDVNHKDASGNYPIHYAAQLANENILKLLLNNDADINAKGKNSQLAIHFAIETKRVTIVKLLLDFGIDIEVRRNSLCIDPFELAKQKGSQVIFDLLTSEYNKRQRNAVPTALEQRRNLHSSSVNFMEDTEDFDTDIRDAVKQLHFSQSETAKQVNNLQRDFKQFKQDCSSDLEAFKKLQHEHELHQRKYLSTLEHLIEKGFEDRNQTTASIPGNSKFEPREEDNGNYRPQLRQYSKERYDTYTSNQTKRERRQTEAVLHTDRHLQSEQFLHTAPHLQSEQFLHTAPHLQSEQILHTDPHLQNEQVLQTDPHLQSETLRFKSDDNCQTVSPTFLQHQIYERNPLDTEVTLQQFKSRNPVPYSPNEKTGNRRHNRYRIHSSDDVNQIKRPIPAPRNIHKHQSTPVNDTFSNQGYIEPIDSNPHWDQRFPNQHCVALSEQQIVHRTDSTVKTTSGHFTIKAGCSNVHYLKSAYLSSPVMPKETATTTPEGTEIKKIEDETYRFEFGISDENDQTEVKKLINSSTTLTEKVQNERYIKTSHNAGFLDSIPFKPEQQISVKHGCKVKENHYQEIEYKSLDSELCDEEKQKIQQNFLTLVTKLEQIQNIECLLFEAALISAGEIGLKDKSLHDWLVWFIVNKIYNGERRNKMKLQALLRSNDSQDLALLID